MIPLILVLAIVETAWSLFSAVTSLNLALFYVGLVAASAVFFIPGVAQKRSSVS
jgi:hypothetical protein